MGQRPRRLDCRRWWTWLAAPRCGLCRRNGVLDDQTHRRRGQVARGNLVHVQVALCTPSQSQESYGRDPHNHKTQVRRSVGSKDRVETNRQTDGRTLSTALSSRLTRSVTRRWNCYISFALDVYRCTRTRDKNMKLSYRRGTARRAMLANSCYVSRGIKVRKVSISKSDLQGHSRALAMVPFDKSHTISY